MKSRRQKQKPERSKRKQRKLSNICFCQQSITLEQHPSWHSLDKKNTKDTSLTSDLAPALSQSTAGVVGIATNKGPPFSRRAETHYHGDTHTSNSLSLTISFPFYFLFPVSKYFILMTSDVLLLKLITLLRLGDFLRSQRDFYLGRGVA